MARLHALLSLLLFSHAASDDKLRIAYVVNTWWPKMDGASIAAMGHVMHFQGMGHPSLVMRPKVLPTEVIMKEAVTAGYGNDPMPAGPFLTYLEYGTVPGARSGGHEIVLDPFGFVEAEEKLAEWAPDVVLVMDPCHFMFDAFRVPSVVPPLSADARMVAKAGHPDAFGGAVTIACFTTHFVDGVYKLQDFWWMPKAARPLLDAGVALSYGLFDHIFVNGEPTRQYLRDTVRLGALGGVSPSPSPPTPHRLGDKDAAILDEKTRFRAKPTEFDLDGRTTVVASRGVPADYCEPEKIAPQCGTSYAADDMQRTKRMHSRRLIEEEKKGGSISFVYVGRLAFDKYVETLLLAYEGALEVLNSTIWKDLNKDKISPTPVLYLAGAGELDVEAKRINKRFKYSIELLGSVAPQYVPCVLKEADVYISAAANETYGRAMVEAMRCKLPLVLMSPSHNNMWVSNGVNGLLAADQDALRDAIVKVVTEEGTLKTLQAGARAAAGGAGAAEGTDEREKDAASPSHNPNQVMLDAVINAHKVSKSKDKPAPHKYHFHYLWTNLFRIGLLCDFLLAAAVDPSKRLTELVSAPAGFWGPVDALHTFCEPSYAAHPYIAELWNSISGLVFVFAGAYNLYKLHRTKLRMRWQATAGWWCLIVDGLGSSAFHATMRYDAELGDELPMLVTIGVAWGMMVGAHPWTRTRKAGYDFPDQTWQVGPVKLTQKQRAFIAWCFGVGGNLLIACLYIATRRYALFVTGFTFGAVVLLIAFLTSDARAISYDRAWYLGKRAAWGTIGGRLVWEVENHLCFLYSWMWVLHSIFHIWLCIAANDLFNGLIHYRIETLGANGVVHCEDLVGKEADPAATAHAAMANARLLFSPPIAPYVPGSPLPGATAPKWAKNESKRGGKSPAKLKLPAAVSESPTPKASPKPKPSPKASPKRGRSPASEKKRK